MVSREDLRKLPFRYECPHCGKPGSHIEKRVKSARASVAQYSEITPTPYGGTHGMGDVADFYCNHCKQPVEEPIDKAA